MGDFLDAPVSLDRPGSATVQRSAMLKVPLSFSTQILKGITSLNINFLFLLDYSDKQKDEGSLLNCCTNVL